MAIPELKASELRPQRVTAPLIDTSWLVEGATPLALAILAYAVMLVVSSRLLGDPDTLFHIAAGRWIWSHGQVPPGDPFSFTMQGSPWIAHEWLAELVFAGAYATLGWVGVIAATALALATTGFLLARFMQQSLSTLAMLVGVGASFVLLQSHLLARPHVLAMPFLVAWVVCLEQSRLKGQPPSFLALPLMTLWANLHGGFVVGLGIACAYALDAAFAPAHWPQRRQVARAWGTFLLCAGIAALITPFGIQGPLFAFHLSSQAFSLEFVNEWHSSDFARFQPLEIWILGLLALGFSLRLRLPLLKLTILVGLIHLALVHRRNTELLALIGPILLADPIRLAASAIARRTPSASPSPKHLIAAGLAVILATGFAWWHGIVYDNPRIAPTRALDAATAAGLTGPVLNAYDFGGYLIFSGIPTFVDGRIDLYGDAFMHDYVDAVSDKGDSLPRTLERDHITWTFLAPSMPAVATLDRAPDWHRVYTDEFAVIHQRRPGAEPKSDRP